MARSDGKPSVTGNQWRAEFFGKANIGRIISGKIVAKLPNPRQENEMGIPYKPEIQQVLNRLFGAARWNRTFPHKAPQDLGDFKIQEMRSMQGLLSRTDPLVDAPPRGGLKKPVYRGGCIQDDHLTARSSLTRRAASIGAATGLR